MNKVIIIGRAGKDPETIKTETLNITKFSLATSEYFKGKDGEKQEKTEWHNIVCFSNLATIAEKYIVKGSQVAIEGKIQTRSWDDKEGNKRYTTEIVANNIELLGSKQDKPAEPPASDFDKPALPLNEQVDTGTGDDLPFVWTILLAVGSLITMAV